MAGVTPSIGHLTDAINHLKGRIGEAFVEALLRRANYSVSRVGREAHVPSLLTVGRTAYMPDFLAWREERIPGPQEKKCARCGRNLTWGEFTADHVRAWSRGGQTSLRNAQPMHRRCNSRKGARAA